MENKKDEACQVSETFLDRLRIEERELHEKMIGLSKGVASGKVPASEQEILNLQLSAMTTYAYVLKLRIARAQNQ
jgi:hypothetical protein